VTTFAELEAIAVAPLRHEARERRRPTRVARRICAGKVRHGSVTAARTVATEIAQKRGGRRMHPYRCPVCHGWHLTSIGRVQ
jgi:hypothetical protein